MVLVQQAFDTIPAERDAIFREDFHAFARKGFAILNDGQQIDDTWHLQAITKRLCDVSTGKITRLIINAPPRSLKSYLASVALPAFAFKHMPSLKFICACYSQDLANKHSSDTRRLMDSRFYRKLFRNFSLTKNTENELQTPQGGFRFATSVGGTLTGRGGDILIVDDPLNASDAFSDATRGRANDWFSRTLVPRLDNKQTGAITLSCSACIRLDVFREKPDVESARHSISDCPQTQCYPDRRQSIRNSTHPILRYGGLQGIIAIEPDKDKKTRMHGQTPKLEARSLILPKTAPWLGDFLSEYLAFPGGRCDDQIDALSQFLGWQSNREMKTRFEADWGYCDQPGLRVPRMDEMLWRLGR